MYPATDHVPTDADREHDGVEWYVRKFRLETTEGEPRAGFAQPEVPEVRSRKWALAIVGVVIGLSALLALATFVVAP